MIVCVTLHAVTDTKGQMLSSPPESTMILLARFSASIFMHTSVEKDVRNGLNMMKYALNHRANFINP